MVLHGTRETGPSTFGEGSTMAQRKWRESTASPHGSTADVRVVPITPTSVAAHVAKLTGNPTMSVVGDLTDEAVVTKLTAQITAKFG